MYPPFSAMEPPPLPPPPHSPYLNWQMNNTKVQSVRKDGLGFLPSRFCVLFYSQMQLRMHKNQYLHVELDWFQNATPEGHLMKGGRTGSLKAVVRYWKKGTFCQLLA